MSKTLSKILLAIVILAPSNHANAAFQKKRIRLTLDSKSSGLPPRYQTIQNGVVQPAQPAWEVRQQCKISGINVLARQYYTSLSHLYCVDALKVVRKTHYGNNERMGKFFKCDNHQVPYLAFWLSTDEEMAAHQEPDRATCPDGWFLKELHTRVLDGDCFIGWDCVAKSGGQ